MARSPNYPCQVMKRSRRYGITETKIQSHPLDIYREQLKQWDKEGLTSVVIHQLLKDKCPCDVQAIRRYRNKHFPKPVEPVMVRSTVPGKRYGSRFW